MEKMHLVIRYNWLVALVAMAFGCTNGRSEDSEISYSAEALADQVAVNGLTCASQGRLSSLTNDEFGAFYTALRSHLEDDGVQRVLNDADICGSHFVGSADVATSTQLLATGNMVVQKINWKSVGASDGTVGTVLVDSLSTDWMCGPGNKQPDPAPDYILQYFFHPNAYNQRQNLRLGYNTWYEQCMTLAFFGGLDSRIWTDNSVRSCMGMTRAHYCSQLYFGMDLAPTGITLVTN